MSCEVCDLKQGQAMVIRVQASSPEILDIPKENTLEFFQKFVGGYIQTMSFTCKGKVMTSILNEEGLIDDLKYNELASHYLNSHVVGDVVIINPKDLT
tara:strand:+ start:245 stop:538 length:294 start_codon:yes stop_codon:yes gene_type:complete